ncbi:hypothetical protein C7B64_15150 [Merismopedia glauca CCAP 1448/3]|uniref:Uncharacterized protein n=1 Tax=Merismopedia glauca CCAP 1448/3 TaxID=1296344 RepID=A0A2T1C1R0_9CYAN|nr:hypothetical protein C7B64_15150 [Merismopedia glauca CCAP 1448/3]
MGKILAVVVDRTWQPGIGDPTLIGWFTVVAYFVTAVLCVLCAKQAAIVPKRYNLDNDDLDDIFIPRKHSSTLRWLWWSLGVVLLFLAINKQLDLQTWLTYTARDLAKSEGWYEQRRMYQLAFIIAIATTIFLFLAIVAVAIKDYWHQVWLAIVGLGLLGSFIVIRAVSFHHIDVLLGFVVGGVKLNAFLELGGISCITISTLKYLRWL